MTLEAGWVGKGTVEGSNLSTHRGLKRWGFRERVFVVCNFSTTVQLYRQYLAGGVLYEILGFVGS